MAGSGFLCHLWTKQRNRRPTRFYYNLTLSCMLSERRYSDGVLTTRVSDTGSASVVEMVVKSTHTQPRVWHNDRIRLFTFLSVFSADVNC